MDKEKISEFFSKDKKLKIITAIGLAGILLIFLSQLDFFKASGKGKNTESTAQEMSLQSYSEELENKIHSLVSCIDGTGSAKVMVTLESGEEFVYVNEEKKSIDKTQDINGASAKKTQEKEGVEQSLIIMEGKDGEQALLKTKIQPKVKGVVVVCTGGDSPIVQQRISDALTTALDIDYSKVCVTKLT